MSFDIFLFSNNLSSEKKMKLNPFTGEKVELYVELGMSEKDEKNVIEYIQSIYPIYFDDEVVRINGGNGIGAIDFIPSTGELGTWSSFSVNLNKISNEIIQVMWGLAVNGKMIIVPVAENSLPIVPEGNECESLASRYTDYTIAKSEADFKALINSCFSQWVQYANKIK